MSAETSYRAVAEHLPATPVVVFGAFQSLELKRQALVAGRAGTR
jgi:hypothetical protein